MRNSTRRRLPFLFLLATVAGCAANDVITGTTGLSFTNTPCSVAGTLQLSVAQTARVDCSNGGTTVTVAGNGASYLVVAQFAVDQVADNFIQYHVSSGTAVLPLSPASTRFSAPVTSALPPMQPHTAQLAFDRMLRARARQKLTSGAWPRAAARNRRAFTSAAAIAVPSVGSLRAFRVPTTATGSTFTTVNARVSYAGGNVILYIDTLAAANGFTSAQLQAFGQLFDQTLYPIDTAAFGPPTDIDQNGRVIMLMSPVVNALTAASVCQTQGYVAGFFDEEDLGGGAADPNSNNGEIFYSIAPDPNGTSSCAHSAADVGFSVPGVFMHELQHLISFSQHAIIHNGNPEFGWLDEGMSIVAEELGSLYYEQKCPGTACRTSPSQLFPDSSQAFVQGFLFDSYQYALLPDTASVTLHADSDDGLSWRGGDWLLVRWLGDQMGAGLYKRLEQSSLTGVANIQNASGQSFPALFADFGLSLFTDSMPGSPRATAPAVDRFVTRNVRQLWARLFVTSNQTDVPLAYPVQLFAITADTSTAVMDPGTNSYFRLDTPANAATVSIQFAGPGGVALPAAMRPQLAIFRLPVGQ
jgi:hypothetical protein